MKKPRMKNKKNPVLALVYCAMLASMSIVLSRYLSISVGMGIRISLGNLPIIISGLMFGPFAGAAVGFAADFIGATVLTGTTPANYNPFLMAGPILMGILPWLVRVIFYGKKRVKHTLPALASITLITHMCTSVLITTPILNYFFMNFEGVAFWSFLGTRALIYAATAIVEAVAIFALLKARAVKIKNMTPGYKMSYEATTTYIHSVSWKGSRLGLSRITELMQKLGNPQDSLKFVHVAGTNGKGSVCSMVNSVLLEAGYTVGLFTSPYMYRFNERIQLNSEPISDEDLAEVTSYVRAFADEMKDSPTEFELITAIALEYFKRKECDVVVFEVGMGGLLDSTNVISTPLVSVITKIDMDHVKELGPTLADITRAKAGIIKDGGIVVATADPTGVIKETVASRNCQLFTMDDDAIEVIESSVCGNTINYKDYKNITVPLAGIYQATNTAIALEVLTVLRGMLNISLENIVTGLENVSWPGRFEIMKKEPLFLYDGAHNMHGLNATLASLDKYFQGRKFIVLTGMMADKDVTHMVELLATCCQKVVTTRPDNPRALDPAELADKFRATKACLGGAFSPDDVYVTGNIHDAIIKAHEIAGENDIICALGSLYMYKDIKGELKND